VAAGPPRGNPRAPPPLPFPYIYRGRERAAEPIYATALPSLSLVAIFFSVVLSEALLRFLHHHRHHAVMLPEDSSYYFTIAR
jgi:hypothetical protein